jgi:hypothetical protein
MFNVVVWDRRYQIYAVGLQNPGQERCFEALIAEAVAKPRFKVPGFFVLGGPLIELSSTVPLSTLGGHDQGSVFLQSGKSGWEAFDGATEG